MYSIPAFSTPPLEDVEETVARALLGTALLPAHAIALDDFLTGEILEARVTVDEELDVVAESRNEVLEIHHFAAECAKERLVHFRVRIGVGALQVFVGLRLVVRAHEAARAHGGVAAGLRHLFENEDVGALLLRLDRGRRTGAAETQLPSARPDSIANLRKFRFVIVAVIVPPFGLKFIATEGFLPGNLPR